LYYILLLQKSIHFNVTETAHVETAGDRISAVVEPCYTGYTTWFCCRSACSISCCQVSRCPVPRFQRPR